MLLLMDPTSYEIRVRGRLGDSVAASFGGLDAVPDGPDTVLCGSIADQPHLHAVLARIEQLGLELIDVHREELT